MIKIRIVCNLLAIVACICSLVRVGYSPYPIVIIPLTLVCLWFNLKELKEQELEYNVNTISPLDTPQRKEWTHKEQ